MIFANLSLAVRIPLKPLGLFLLLAATAVGAKEKDKDHDESLILATGKRVSVTVPAGYVYSSGRDESGAIMAKVADAKEKVVLQVQFLPDPDGRFATEQPQMEYLARACQQYAEGSVEKSYNFTPLAPHRGAGTYCVFTDASLVGTEPPKGQVLNVTTGIKSWPGWFFVFTVLSNDTTSKEYQTALKLVKESFEEIPAAVPSKA